MVMTESVIWRLVAAVGVVNKQVLVESIPFFVTMGPANTLTLEEELGAILEEANGEIVVTRSRARCAAGWADASRTASDAYKKMQLRPRCMPGTSPNGV